MCVHCIVLQCAYVLVLEIVAVYVLVCVSLSEYAGLDEMLANIRRQHEVWANYLGDAREGTPPISRVTVTHRPQHQYVKCANTHMGDVV